MRLSDEVRGIIEEAFPGSGNAAKAKEAGDKIEALLKARVRPASAFTAVVGDRDYGIGRADKGTFGYTPCPQFGRFGSYEAAVAKAKELNEEMGLDEAEALKLVLGTMRRV